MSVVVVSNVTASRASRHLEALRALLPEGDDVRHHVTTSGPELDPLLGHDRWAPDDLLVINGGDGSVQHALTLLLHHCPTERLPRLACLPGGTTNMTAYDVNHHRRFRDCLTALGDAVSGSAAVPGPVVPRPVVRVAPGDGGGPARCGLFFGMGTIVQGIEYFHARIRHGGGAHELGAGVALARTIWGMARGEPPFAEPARVRVDGDDWAVRLLLVTTLDRLLLGLRPYWGQGAGALKATAVEARAGAFLRRLPRLLRGRPHATMTPEAGWHSAGTDALTVAFEGPYTLDGELFRSSGATMRVSASPAISFVPL